MMTALNASQVDPSEIVAGPLEERIVIRGLNFFYGQSKALKGISLPLRANCVTAFIGPSGCG